MNFSFLTSVWSGAIQDGGMQKADITTSLIGQREVIFFHVLLLVSFIPQLGDSLRVKVFFFYFLFYITHLHRFFFVLHKAFTVYHLSLYFTCLYKILSHSTSLAVCTLYFLVHAAS